MNKQKADDLITEYLPKIYGYAISKSFFYDEAEELCADITEELYRSLIASREIYNTDGYIWRICEHVYARYVSSKKQHLGISIDGMEISYEENFAAVDAAEDMLRLRREIAFLTKTRREIVYSFYYEDQTISYISKEMGIPEGTIKWHLNKARNELRGGINMERKIGKLGMKPLETSDIGHGGTPGSNGGPEYYLGDKLNLNIVYSVYFTPRTKEEIAEELGITPVFIEDRITFLENNGFLVRQPGCRFTTYVWFDPETYSLEQREKTIKKKQEIAQLLCTEYVPFVRAAMAHVKDVYIPSGNRELLEAAAILYGIMNKCQISVQKDLSPYCIKTTDGGHYIAYVTPPATQTDPDYKQTLDMAPYWICGDMTRQSERYPSVFSWSIDSRYCSREGNWKNNLTSDYEYLYEFMTGMIAEDRISSDKFRRLRERQFLTADNKVNIMVVKGDWNAFFDKIPPLDETLKKTFADYALETAAAISRKYPPQMRDLVISREAGGFIGGMVALMVKDILHENGSFRKLTEEERVTADLLMFSDVLPAI